MTLRSGKRKNVETEALQVSRREIRTHGTVHLTQYQAGMIIQIPDKKYGVKLKHVNPHQQPTPPNLNRGSMELQYLPQANPWAEAMNNFQPRVN
jgi:hypothetical protein